MKARAIEIQQGKIEQVLQATLFILLLILLAFVGLACFYISYPEGDPFEHLHVTYLMLQGQVPYRDFFEHHHPLLWFLSMPLVSILDRNSEIYGWANYCTFLFFSVGGYYLYRTIIEFMGNRFVALAALIFILLPEWCLYYIYFKPDNWMFSCIFIGIYFYFRYMRDKKGKDLIWAFVWFTISFLFLQKAVFYLSIIGVMILWALYKKEIHINDFFKAIILPVIIMGAFLGYFAYHSALHEYFLFNFTFNQQMVPLFGSQKTSLPVEMCQIFIWAGLFVSFGLYKFESKYFRFYCWLFWSILLQRLFYFSPHLYYWYDVYVIAIPLVAAGAYRLILMRRVLQYIIFVEMLLYALFMGYDIFQGIISKPKENSISKPELLIRLTNRCDKVARFGNLSGVIFNPILGYYWFLNGELDVFGDKLGIHPLENFNQIIERERPKLIFVHEVEERYSGDKEKRIIHKPDVNLIKKMYYPTAYAGNEIDFDLKQKKMKNYGYRRGIWLLKSEYRQTNCHFDKELGVWKYED